MNTDYRHLNVDERVFIQLALERGCTLRAIARSVQRAPSTISRELARNAWIRPPKHRGRGRRRLAGGYRAVPAQERAVLLAQTPRVSSRLAPRAVGTGGPTAAPAPFPGANQRHTAQDAPR
jgi:IS30 family transposase